MIQDLNLLSEKNKISLTIHNEKDADALMRRIKEYTLFYMCILVTLCAFFYFGYQLIKDPNDHISFTIETSIISALLGYLTGRKTR